jgi:hypothetical protein
MYFIGADNIGLTTGGTLRVDISDSGLKLGSSGSRVTTILDENDMASDSDTSLATQQSIKAYVDANAGGGVSLANDGNNRVVTATGSGGINGEANLTFDGTTLAVTASGTSTTLLLESTDAGAADAPILELYRNSASPANTDDLGQILWSGEKSDGSKYSITKMYGQINTVDNSDRLMINIASSGGSGLNNYEYMRFDGGVRDVIINEDGRDIDFRIEGDSDSSLFFTDASSDRIGIGTTSPNQKLTLEGTMSLKEQASANADTAAYGQLWVKSDSPNNLYFTNDAGNDVQITDGSSLAGGSDTDVNVSNLTARLPQITESVTIGDATDVTVTTSGDLTVTGDLNVSEIVDTTGNGHLRLRAGGSSVNILDGGVANHINITPASGRLNLMAETIAMGDADVTMTTRGAYDLTLDTNGGTNSGAIKIFDGANGNISLTPNGTGNLQLSTGNGFALLGGADLGGTSQTDDTRKFFRMGMPHYDTDEEPFSIISGDADDGDNKVFIGGGTSQGNAASFIFFNTATNSTTTTGSTRMTIKGDGKIGIGDTNPLALLHLEFAGGDTTTYGPTNETFRNMILLRNNTVSTDAFAGIAFDVSTESDFDSIGASISAVRDTSAGSTAGNHDTNLVFATNDAGDDTNTERMRITHDGDVNISNALNINNVSREGNTVSGSSLADGSSVTLFTVPVTTRGFKATIFFKDTSNTEYQIEEIMGYNTGSGVDFTSFGQVFSGAAAIGSLDATDSSGTTLIKFTNAQGSAINYQASINVTHMDLS